MPTSTRYYAENVSAPGSSSGSIGPTHRTNGSFSIACNTTGNVDSPGAPGVDKQ